MSAAEQIDEAVAELKTLAFIEERVADMMAIWSEDDLETMPLPPSIENQDGGVALHGPAGGDSTGNASQADIDRLFG